MPSAVLLWLMLTCCCSPPPVPAAAAPPPPTTTSTLEQLPPSALGSGAPSIELDNRTGAYAVMTARWRLPGGPIRIFCSGRWYCSDHDSVCHATLQIACVNPATVGTDALGQFHDISIVWASNDGVVQSLITQWRTYRQLDAVVFNTRMKTVSSALSVRGLSFTYSHIGSHTNTLKLRTHEDVR